MADLDTDGNKRFVATMQKDYGVDPGQTAAGLYIAAAVVEAGLEKNNGKSDDTDAFVKALRVVDLKDTPRGPIKFDHFQHRDRRFLRPPLRKSERQTRQQDGQYLS